MASIIFIRNIVPTYSEANNSTSYRELLDTWQLWHKRALLDVARIPYTEPKPPPQVFARCNFCNQSLSLNMINSSAKLARAGRTMMALQSASGKSSNAEKKQRVGRL